MIIYIEGVDGSGKTTLAAKLADRLEQLKSSKNIKVVPEAEPLVSTRPDKPNRISQFDLMNKLMEMATDLTTVYIMDRGPLSDIIYRTFDEYEPVLSLTEYTKHWAKLQWLIVTVYCSTSQSEMLMKQRGDDNEVSLTRHHEIAYLYKQIMPLFGSFEYDLSKDEEQTTVNRILARLWFGLETWYMVQKRKEKEGTKNELKEH